MRKNSILNLLVLFLLTSCAAPDTPTATQPVVPMDTQSMVVVTEPSTNESSTPIPEPTPTPVLHRAQYSLDVFLDYAEKTINVEQTILYPNKSGETLTNLVMAVVPNLWPGGFVFSDLSVDGVPVTEYSFVGQALEFSLPQLLAPEQTVIIELQYILLLPYAAQTNPSEERPRIYGYTDQQINLTNWYPFVVPVRPGQGWLLHDPWYYGEHLVYDAADYQITLRFADPVNPPAVAASAPARQDGDALHYSLMAGRTFAFSLSPYFKEMSTEANDILISSYYFPQFFEGGEAALKATARAVEIYSERFGPYPHESLAIVQGDFNDGMEYSAFFYLSRDFYNLYSGVPTPGSYLITVAVHEAAHQWWFEKVANDQALEPWLDETLCTYSEHIYYETASPESLYGWWWPVRVDYYRSNGYIDITLYEGGGFRPYTDSIYLNGAHFLDELRQRIGDETFFAFLQGYGEKYAGQIVTADDFFSTLRLYTDVDISDLIRTYFKNYR